MIKIQRCPRPHDLTDEKIKDLTQLYIEKDIAVWRKKYIKDALYNMSNGKCCFCETLLGEEGKFMQVEHFHPKNKYKEEVVVWENLLPCCNRCNGNKGTHDTYEEPILDPTIFNPKEHFYFKNFRYKAKDEIGKRTIEVMYLNDTEGLVNPRYKIGNAIQEKMDDILEMAIRFDENVNKPTRNKNRIINGVKDILREAQPSSQYSALVATVIFEDENYQLIKDIIIKNDLWDEKIQDLEDNAKKISYESIYMTKLAAN